MLQIIKSGRFLRGIGVLEGWALGCRVRVLCGGGDAVAPQHAGRGTFSWVCSPGAGRFGEWSTSVDKERWPEAGGKGALVGDSNESLWADLNQVWMWTQTSRTWILEFLWVPAPEKWGIMMAVCWILWESGWKFVNFWFVVLGRLRRCPVVSFTKAIICEQLHLHLCPNNSVAIWKSNQHRGFPHSSVSKEFACSAGDLGSIPGLGKSPGEGNGNQLQYSCLENPMDRGAWWAPVHGVARVRHDLATKLLPINIEEQYISVLRTTVTCWWTVCACRFQTGWIVCMLDIWVVSITV